MRLIKTDAIHASALKKALIAFLVLGFSSVWTTYNSNLLTHQWGWELTKTNPVPMWIAQFVSIPLLSAMLIGGVRLIKLDKKFLGLYLGYTLWFVALFLGYAPGCMTEDSFYTFHMVKHGWWGGWYSVLHPVLITAFLQIFPIDFFAPGLFLSLLWAAVFVILHGILFSLNAKTLIHFLLPILALTPAAVAASLIVIRDSYFTALFIVFCVLAFRTVFFRTRMTLLSTFLLGLLGGVLVVYRADAIPSVILGLTAVFLMQRPARIGAGGAFSTVVMLLLPITLLIVCAKLIPHMLESNWIKGNTWDSRAEREYKLTLIENPLGYIVQNPAANVEKVDRQAIEQVFKFSDLSQHYCPGNICVFYGNFWNKNSNDEERNGAFRAALNVFFMNPTLFFGSRFKTLQTVGEKNGQTVCSRSISSDKGYEPLAINPSLYGFGDVMVSLIQKTETKNGSLGGSRVWWNVYLWSFICGILMLAAPWTPASALFAALLLIRTVVVAIAAPAGFTVYYLTLFLGGPILLILWALEFRTRAGKRLLAAGEYGMIRL